MKPSEIKESWTFIENIGSISYWLEQTDDGSGKTIGPEEVLEIGCQLEAKNERHGKMLDNIADWLEKVNNDPLGAITEGYPSPENMIAYLRQRAWEELLEKEQANA